MKNDRGHEERAGSDASGARDESSESSAAWSTSSGLMTTRLTQPADINAPGGNTGSGSEDADPRLVGEPGGGGDTTQRSDTDAPSGGGQHVPSPDAGESPAAALNQHVERVSDDAAELVAASAGDLGTTTGVNVTAGTGRQGADTSPDSVSPAAKSWRQRFWNSRWVQKARRKG